MKDTSFTTYMLLRKDLVCGEAILILEWDRAFWDPQTQNQYGGFDKVGAR
jgi:hypothetical protein